MHTKRNNAPCRLAVSCIYSDKQQYVAVHDIMIAIVKRYKIKLKRARCYKYNHTIVHELYLKGVTPRQN